MVHSVRPFKQALNAFHTELNRIALFIDQYLPNGIFYNKQCYTSKIKSKSRAIYYNYYCCYWTLCKQVAQRHQVRGSHFSFGANTILEKGT